MLQRSARGIVLKKTKYSESDLIVQIIVSTGEKISCLARGALRSRKRFAGGVLDPTQYIQFQYKENGNRLCTIEEAQVIDGFDGLRSDYDRMETALLLVSQISKLSMEGDDSSPGLFNLLGHALKSLQVASDFSLFKAAFGLKLLLQQGVLEHEIWMRPIFQLSFKDWNKAAESHLEISAAQMAWIDLQIRQFLESASVSHPR